MNGYRIQRVETNALTAPREVTWPGYRQLSRMAAVVTAATSEPDGRMRVIVNYFRLRHSSCLQIDILSTAEVSPPSSSAI
jgi:hypothetical protein